MNDKNRQKKKWKTIEKHQHVGADPQNKIKTMTVLETNLNEKNMKKKFQKRLQI